MKVGEFLKEFAIALGLDTDAASFAAGMAAVEALKTGIEFLVEKVVEVVKAIPEMTMAVAENAHEIELAAQKAGIGTEAFQELTYASGLMHVSAEELTMALGRLSRNMFGVQEGGGDIARAFEKLGIKTQDAAGNLRPLEDVLGDVAEQFSKMPDGPTKSALAMELFSRGGLRMIPLLNKGRAGMAELREEAHRLGVVLDENAIKMGAETAQASHRMHAAIQGLKNTIAVQFLPVMERVITGITKWITAHRVLIGQIFGVLLKVFKVLAAVIGGVWHVVSAIVDEFVRLGTIAYNLSPTLWKIVAVVGALALAFTLLGAPIILVGLLIAAAFLVVEDLITGIEGGQSVLFEFWDTWKGFLHDFVEQPKGDDPWWLSMIRQFGEWFLNAPKAWADMVDAWKQIFDDFVDYINERLVKIARFAVGVLKVVSPGAAAGARQFIDEYEATKTGVSVGAGFGAGFAAIRERATVNQAPTYNLTINAPSGNALDIAGTVKKALDEHTKEQFRAALAAVGGGL